MYNKIIISSFIILTSLIFAQPDPYEDMCWEFNDLTGGYSWVDCNGGDFDIDIYGCIDPLATNYNPMATIDNQSCYYGWSIEACLSTECGQMLQSGMNCNQITDYGVDCSECEECNTDPVFGCTDSNADNYNPQATLDDGTCEYSECESGFVEDCSGDGDCCEEAWIGDGFPDCEDQQYDCDLTCYENDGGDCLEDEDVNGCTDSNADNYNPEATIDDGTCLYNGCPTGQVQNCDNSGSCIDSFFIGDGWCQDGNDSEYNFDLSCYDNDGGDCEEHQEELDLILTLISPQGGEHIEDYTNVEVRWEYEGTDVNDINLSFSCSYYLGGGLIEVANNINLSDGSTFIDLSTDVYGEDINAETIFANFKIIASNENGLSTEVECSEEFIIGDPRGELNANYIDEEESSIVIDWAWMEDQTIIIENDAIQILLEEGFEFIKIFDSNGIHSSDCSDFNETGPTSLSVLDLRELLNNGNDIPITLPCGFDYCYEDGQRIPGYLPENQIHFSTGHFNGYEYQLMPESAQVHDGAMLFDNGTYIINSFSLGLVLNEQITSSQEDRDWDSFNIYGKVTNHQGSSTRECNEDDVCQEGESLVDCFVDCCTSAGTGDNIDWCLLETVNGITNFQDNLINGNYVPYVPAGTSSATLNYRVWLLDDDDLEVVKTIDTEIDYESSILFCDKDGDINGDNFVNVIDIVTLVEHTLGNNLITDLILLCEADINSDDEINIIDIVGLVGIILGE